MVPPPRHPNRAPGVLGGARPCEEWRVLMSPPPSWGCRAQLSLCPRGPGGHGQCWVPGAPKSRCGVPGARIPVHSAGFPVSGSRCPGAQCPGARCVALPRPPRARPSRCSDLRQSWDRPGRPGPVCLERRPTGFTGHGRPGAPGTSRDVAAGRCSGRAAVENGHREGPAPVAAAAAASLLPSLPPRSGHGSPAEPGPYTGTHQRPPAAAPDSPTAPAAPAAPDPRRGPHRSRRRGPQPGVAPPP